MHKKRFKEKKQQGCSICHKRPVWNDKNTQGHICKRCYHRHVWDKRPSGQRKATARAENLDEQIKAFSQNYGVSDSDSYYWLFLRQNQD